MTNEERKIFWETLCSLKGDNLESDFELLQSTIKVPQSLFRYRSISTASLSALSNNTLYFSTSSYYDDPFDTFLHIDMKTVRENFASNFSTKEQMNSYINSMKEVLREPLLSVLGIKTVEEFNEEKVHQMIEDGLIESFMGEISKSRDFIKKYTHSICFCEDIFNEALWIKYADMHKGFVLEYNGDKLLCGKMADCDTCNLQTYSRILYPIYYSDENYDATNFALYMYSKEISNTLGNPKMIEEYCTSLGGQKWERERVALIKKKCHEHDKEWRILLCSDTSTLFWLKWVPTSITIGLRMNESEVKLLYTVAQTAGIQYIYEAYIDDENKLNRRLINEIK